MLAAVGTLYVARRIPRLLPFLLYPWLYALVFGIANPLIFRWYLTPPMPAYFFAIVCGAWALIDALSELRRRQIQQINMQGQIPMTPRSVGRIVALVMLAALWIGMSLNAWTLHPDHGPDRPAPVMAWHKIELDYQKIGIELRDKYGVKADTRVASADIGVIGYFSGATIIDTVGLVTPALSRYYPIDPSLIAQGQNYAIPPQFDPGYETRLFRDNGSVCAARSGAKRDLPKRLHPARRDSNRLLRNGNASLWADRFNVCT